MNKDAEALSRFPAYDAPEATLEEEFLDDEVIDFKEINRRCQRLHSPYRSNR